MVIKFFNQPLYVDLLILYRLFSLYIIFMLAFCCRLFYPSITLRLAFTCLAFLFLDRVENLFQQLPIWPTIYKSRALVSDHIVGGASKLIGNFESTHGTTMQVK